MMEYRTISNCVIRIKLFFTRISIIWEWLRQIWIPTSSTKLAEAEQRLLSFVRFPFEQNQISIGDNLTINTIHTYNPKARQSNRKAPLVLLHGFGAGIGFWLLNIDALAEQYEHVYAIDLLGCGRSSRPHFRAKTPEEAERFFVDALERWRIKVNLEKMILLGEYIYNFKKILNFIFMNFFIGHSLGAYIGASYTMSFPYRVPHLILASPVGVPKEPDTPLPSRRYFHSSLTWRLGRDLTIFLWKRGYTPQSGVRFMGPLGPLPVNIYVTRRFSIQPGIEDTSPATDEAGLETSAALADQIDKGKLKLPKQDLAQYLVCNILILSCTYRYLINFFSIIYVLNLAVVNLVCLVLLNQMFLHISH